MSIPPWLFGLIAIPVFYLIAFILYHVIEVIPVFISIFLGIGVVVAFVLFLIKWTGRERVVSPMNGDRDKNYDFFYKLFSDKGFEISEYEPLDGRKMTVYLDHPRKSHFVLIGIFLLMTGVFPGIVWFMFGSDKFSLTLKENAGYALYVFKSNSRYAGKAWGKIIFKINLKSIEPPPENIETTVEII